MYSNDPPMQGIANSMAQHGRYGDSMLVHMNPHEVQGIAALSPTGKLTTNPITGQPEAFLPFLAPLLGSMFGSTMLGGLGSALGGTALGTALTSAAGMPALAGAIGSGLATTAVTGDLEKGIMSGLTGFGLGSAIGAAGDALNPQIGETAAAMGEASTAASEAGQNLALMTAETAEPIAKAIEMGALPATNPLTGELVNQGFSPAAVTDPFTGAVMNTAALNPSQIAMADPMQKLLGAEGARNAASAKVANLSEQLSSLRGAQTAGDKILAPFKQPGVFGKQFLEPGVLAPIAIGEGQRAQMQAVEEAEERNRRFEREREEDYRRNAANMVGAYDQLEQDYPWYKVARDSQYAAAGGITSIDPNNYMDNIKGLQRLAGGGVVKMPFGGSIPNFGGTEINKAGAAARQAGIRGTEVISPEELAGYRPGFSPEINYFRAPANPNSANQAANVNPDLTLNGNTPSTEGGYDYNNFNFADWVNTEAGAANVSTLRDALNIPSFDPTSLQSQIDTNRELASTPSFDPESFKSDILSNIPSFDPDILSNIPSFDASELQDRLSALETMETPSFDDSALREMIAANTEQFGQIPSFDASGIQGQIDALRNQPGVETPSFDASGLQKRLSALETREIPSFDASGLQERLSAVENRNIPGFDASGLQTQIDAMRNQPGFDASGLQSQIDAMRNKPGFDASGLQERLSAVESREIPGFDASGLQGQIDAMRNQPGFDASGLQGRLSALETREIPGFDASGLQERLSAVENRNIPGFDASGLQGQIDALRNQPGFDASGLQERLSAVENRNIPGFDDAALREMIAANTQSISNAPSFDASGIQSQIDALSGQPGFDDAALREMIAANTQSISNAPSFDDAALREMIAANSQQIQNAPSFDASRFNLGVGMAEGRLVENELADESMLETKETNGQLVIERAVMAISGRLSPEDSEAAVNVFLDEFGPEAFQVLREKVLQDIVPGAQVEGEVSGTGAGMDDEVVGMIGDQQPIAVSPGEYIVPADVVSGIGDGSTDAGAGELDEMLERVRMERTGTTEQPQPMRRGGGLPA